ncbi:hypothetical protein RRG08_051272 [Elysia crispata]|uniref:Uncharacterized protein n=1 Tax=Elysia crispata TaxID=231223 RepID=A0AAE0YBK8_9GAST|nr:hypothetical protein RRG08_051272 [Elysia crispata]
MTAQRFVCQSLVDPWYDLLSFLSLCYPTHRNPSVVSLCGPVHPYHLFPVAPEVVSPPIVTTSVQWAFPVRPECRLNCSVLIGVQFQLYKLLQSPSFNIVVSGLSPLDLRSWIVDVDLNYKYKFLNCCVHKVTVATGP